MTSWLTEKDAAWYYPFTQGGGQARCRIRGLLEGEYKPMIG